MLRGCHKCCWVAINVAGLPNVRETLLQKNYSPNSRQYKHCFIVRLLNKKHIRKITHKSTIMSLNLFIAYHGFMCVISATLSTSLLNSSLIASPTCFTLCQFHQHFTSNFFCQYSFNKKLQSRGRCYKHFWTPSLGV